MIFCDFTKYYMFMNYQIHYKMKLLICEEQYETPQPLILPSQKKKRGRVGGDYDDVLLKFIQ